LQKYSRIALINLTGAMRERFDTERQRLDNERLSNQLSGEKSGYQRLQRVTYGLGALSAVLAVIVVALLRRPQTSLKSASAT